MTSNMNIYRKRVIMVYCSGSYNKIIYKHQDYRKWKNFIKTSNKYNQVTKIPEKV